MMKPLPKHGSPADRGSADKYYGRQFEPHWYPAGTYKGVRICREDMTADELKEYRDAYNNEDDEKDWG